MSQDHQTVWFAQGALLLTCVFGAPLSQAADTRFARSDSSARYLHHINFYDVDNRRITPTSTKPYSPINTCGRCHDYETISHGWHFNAFLQGSTDGRQGEPWIWTDARTGTQLPLSYRDWQHGSQPEEVGLNASNEQSLSSTGIDAWAMVRHFGGRLPGGGLGHAPDPNQTTATNPRWAFTGSLEIDCLVCHAVSGTYDLNLRKAHIEMENFAWAPTASIRLGRVMGGVSRIKDDEDPSDEKTIAKLPVVEYDTSRFNPDGTVFVDLVRKPENNACYQCHSQRIVNASGMESRWIHDEDVHLQSGMDCVDCHRNGVDHHIVRGFPGEQHPSGASMITLSCAGCHLGSDFAYKHGAPSSVHDELVSSENLEATLAGRLGSPTPAHAGMPPLHFEKLSCTACHGGPLPRKTAVGVMTSLAHALGEKGHRSGSELPRMFGGVYAKQPDGRIYPHRVTWPAFWGYLDQGGVQPLEPEKIYQETRRSLRVRKDFVAEVVLPELGSRDLKSLLGDDRYRVEREAWTPEELANVTSAEREAGQQLFSEKVIASLTAIEEAFGVEQAVYVSAGNVYAVAEDVLTTIEVEDRTNIEMQRWPIAHPVRPAGWSLGIDGCTECHRDDALMFASTVTPAGPGPEEPEPILMADLQELDPDQRLAWNQLFANRASFKYVIGGSLILLAAILLFTLGLLLGQVRRPPAMATERIAGDSTQGAKP